MNESTHETDLTETGEVLDLPVTPPEVMSGPRAPETTHAGWGAGDPRLVAMREDERLEFPIVGDRMSIGSAFASDLRLEGAEDLHAEIVHDSRDEYVLVPHAVTETGRAPEPIETLDGVPGEVLHTGARFTAGPWTIVFLRDEFADHGRPHGGRQGGEYSDQEGQPARPDYRAEASARS